MERRIIWVCLFVICSSSPPAFADVRISSPHQPAIESQRAEFVRTCVNAIQDRWRGAKLVLNHRARHGFTETGERVLTALGTVWQAGERVDVLNQCSSKTGSNQLALYTEAPLILADAKQETTNFPKR